MTLGDLRKLVNSIDTKHDDKQITFFYEKDGLVCQNPFIWFDLFVGKDYKTAFGISLCETKQDFESHEGRVPWTDVDEYSEGE